MTGSPLDTRLVSPSPPGGIEASGAIVPRGSSARRLALLLLGGVLVDIALPFLGLDPLPAHQELPTFAVLSLYALGFAAAIWAVGAQGIAYRVASLAVLVERHRRLAAALLIGAGIAGAIACMMWVFRAFPDWPDEYVYLLQARTFLAGRLWNPLPPLPALVAYTNMVFVHGRWVSGYTPGWPLLLAAVMGLRLPPWLASPLCGGVLLFVVLKLGEKRNGALGGILAAALVALSPYFLFNAGDYLDMVPAAAAGLLFCWAAVAFLDCPRWTNAIGAGLALGMLGLIRSQDVVLFGLPFAVQFLWRAKRRHYLAAPGIILAGLPFLAALLLYDHAMYGSLLPQYNIAHSAVRFGLFPVNSTGHHLTPLDELGFAARGMVLLSNWTSLFLLLGSVAAFGFVAYRRQLSFLDFIFPTYVLGFMLVPSTGYIYGPRYYFEGFAPLVLTVVSALVPLLRDPRFSRWRTLAASLLVAHSATCLASVAVMAPFWRMVVDQKMDLYNQVNAKNLHNAVVVVHSPTGLSSQLAGGFQMTPDQLVRNGMNADGKVLYVRDIPDQIEKMRRLFPDRQFYIYTRDPRDPKGSLRRLR